MSPKKVFLDQPILPQLKANLNGIERDNGIHIPPDLGKGFVESREFMNGLEFLYYQYSFFQPYQQITINPPDSTFYVIMVNLSKKAISKIVNDEEFIVHKYQPVGVLAYPPDSKIQSGSHPGEVYEMVLFKFPSQFLRDYFPEEVSLLQSFETLIYEDLNHSEEKLLEDLLKNRDHKLKAHGLALEFIGEFISHVQAREKPAQFSKLHPEDTKGIFAACGILRDPLNTEVPTVAELALMAQMSPTKFKVLFNQVFGTSPKQYHSKIKMSFAQKEILEKNVSISEISYQLGYSHPSKFTKAYKKHFGVLPSEQRTNLSKRANQ